MSLAPLVESRGARSAMTLTSDVVRRPALIAAAVTMAFVGITIWWLSVDRQIPVFDPGMHLEYAFGDWALIRQGRLFAPFEIWTAYPPLVHLVGALAVFLGGLSVAGPVVALDLVFVPLLAVACYRTARMSFGAGAGVLAVLFALGTPMLQVQFHEFFIDPPEAAMAAGTVWLLLESRRLERGWVAAAAGIVCGLGFLTKQSFPVFVGGVFLVILARGGWRHWRGLTTFLALTAAIAAPWYVYHLAELRALVHVTDATVISTAPTSNAPPRYSLQNAGWYLWSELNFQLLLPLTAFAAIGVVWSVVALARGRLRDTPVPELLIGGLVAYLGVTYQLPHDPRYSLPGLIFLAVLGTGWITKLPRRLPRLLVGAAFLAAIVMGTIGATFGAGPGVGFTLPGAPTAPGSVEGRVTLASPTGYLVSGPERAGNLVSVLRDERRLGLTTLQWDPTSAAAPFSGQGIGAEAWMAGMAQANGPRTSIAPHVLFLLYEPVASGAVPCVRLWNGAGVWLLARESATGPPVVTCPTHRSTLGPA